MNPIGQEPAALTGPYAGPYECPTCGEPFTRTEMGTYEDLVTLLPGGELRVSTSTTELDDATQWRCENGHFRPCVRSYDGKGVKCLEHLDLWGPSEPACVTAQLNLTTKGRSRPEGDA